MHKVKRIKFLVAGTLAMLLAGVVYAWSILKAPLAEEFGWGASQLTVNFTITMCCFCIGGFLGGKIAGILGQKITIIAGGILAGAGFVLTSMLGGGSIAVLYVTYGVMAGLGIGIVYVVTISTVTSWFPEKRGICSGCLMMGFGASTLIIGKLADASIQMAGWRMTFVLLGIIVAAVIIAAASLLRLPGPEDDLPQLTSADSEDDASDIVQYTTGEMIRRVSFWKAFVCIVFLAAVGNTVISFARDLALSLDASAGLATSLVGVLAVANGIGRILTGMMFDHMGRRTSMIIANIIAIAAASSTLVAVMIGSLPLGIIGLCMTGLSYGACPTITSVFTSAFYGTKHFSSNFSVMNFNLMGASLIATVSSMLLEQFGDFRAPFVLLVVLSVVALILNLSIRRP